MTKAQNDMIAKARHIAILDLGKDASTRLIHTRTIVNLKISRNASKLKAKWQAVIDMLEAQNVTA